VRAELRPRVPPVLVLSSPAERSGWPAVSTRKPWESFLADADNQSGATAVSGAGMNGAIGWGDGRSASERVNL